MTRQTQRKILSSDNNTILTYSASSNRTHINESALIAHVEGVVTITEDLSVGSAWSDVLANDLSVHTLHASCHVAHEDIRA